MFKKIAIKILKKIGLGVVWLLYFFANCLVCFGMWAGDILEMLEEKLKQTKGA